MLGAIATTGSVEGGPVHLGLAPALLVALLVRADTGAGGRLRRPACLPLPDAYRRGVLARERALVELSVSTD
jgi:hypothetical protein